MKTAQSDFKHESKKALVAMTATALSFFAPLLLSMYATHPNGRVVVVPDPAAEAGFSTVEATWRDSFRLSLTRGYSGIIGFSAGALFVAYLPGAISWVSSKRQKDEK